MIKRLTLNLLLIWIWFSSWFLLMNYHKVYSSISSPGELGATEYGFSIRLDVEVERTAYGYMKEEIFFWSKLWLPHLSFIVGLSIVNILSSLRQRTKERRMINES